MNRVFVIGDTHFGHSLMARTRPWPTIEEHDRQLVERWNATVRKEDTVYHLGDVAFGGPANIAITRSLNGIKHLVMGNHDSYPIDYYLETFRHVHGCAVKHGVLMTHIPVHPGQEYRYHKNVHGHMHEKCIENPWYFCASADRIEYKPMRLSEILEKR